MDESKIVWNIQILTKGSIDGWNTKRCLVDGCESEARINGFCSRHNWQIKNYGYIVPGSIRKLKKCSIAGCNHDHYAKGLCRNHYAQYRRRNLKIKK